MHPAQLIAARLPPGEYDEWELKRFLLLASDKRDPTRRLRNFFGHWEKVLDTAHSMRPAGNIDPIE